MKKTVIVMLFLLACVGMVYAQDDMRPGSSTSRPTNPAQSPDSSVNDPAQTTNPGAQNPPAGAPQAQAPMKGDTKVVEGCLGGSNPNFTVKDKTGTEYQMKVPQGTDVSVLSKHVGEAVQVEGVIMNSGTSSGADASSPTASSGSGNQKAIAVSRVGRGQGQCPGSTAGGAAPQTK